MGRIFGYLDENIHSSKYLLIDIHSWSIYSDKYIWIFICSTSIIANIFWILIVSKKCWEGLLLVQNSSILVKNNTKYENGQHIQKQSWVNYLIFEYIRIFWMNILIPKNICWHFLGRIYSDIHLWYFSHAEYIWLLICPIYMVTDIFRYPFVQKKDIRPTL